MDDRPHADATAFFAARAATWDDRFPDDVVDAVFAAGLIHHLPPPDHGLIELARITAPDARLAVFHPVSRAALAARARRLSN